MQKGPIIGYDEFGHKYNTTLIFYRLIEGRISWSAVEFFGDRFSEAAANQLAFVIAANGLRTKEAIYEERKQLQEDARARRRQRRKKAKEEYSWSDLDEEGFNCIEDADKDVLPLFSLDYWRSTQQPVPYAACDEHDEDAAAAALASVATQDSAVYTATRNTGDFMSNILTTVGHDIKIGAEDTAKGVVKVVDFLPKAITIVGDAIKDQPAIKAAVLALIQKATTVIGDGASAVADKGIDLAQDATALADAEAFFDYFKADFIPLVEQVYSEVKADIETQAA